MQFFKRLEIQGFKSFAAKTTIEFLPGVTVIVGPNGSGKSNIFDAIRWVLGEQSAKSLRGARMGDVIFNGSGTLKASGMAKVELVVDNSRRHLPLDFDEVSLARHLYRTGESEYLLNRTPCRLRDITELLMDTGIGTDSYSVLEQGRVDAVINSRPLERRIIFDEAVGISKYKSKKEEALAKLARTEENLVRLADIIAEVRRQANSLKRQAQKAERYKRYAHQLELLEKQWLVYQAQRLREEREAIEKSYAALEARLEELRELVERAEAEQEEKRRASDTIRTEFEQVRAESFAVGNQLTQARSQIELLEQRLADGRTRAHTLSQELARVVERLAALDEQLVSLSQERQNYAQAFAQVEEEYHVKKADYDRLKAQVDAASFEVLELRKRAEQLRTLQANLESQRQVAHAMEAKLRGELERCELESTAWRQQIEALQIEKDEAQSALEEAEQLLEALKVDQRATSERLAALEQTSQELRRQLDSVRQHLQAHRSRHQALVELQENFEGYFGGVREVMLRAKARDLHGIVGVVSTLLEAADEHELAIEVALGSQAQDIVVERAEDAKAAIDWLKRSGRGRATFLPLDLIEPSQAPPRWEEMRQRPGVIDLASNLVRYDPRLQAAVRYLLGGVVVCRDLDAAIALQRQGFRARFVTLEGELVVPRGAMTGGSIKSQGLLHRTREIRKLADEIRQLEATEASLQARAEEAGRELAAARELFQKLAASVNRQEIEAARAKKDHEVIEQKLREKLSTARALDERRRELEAELARYRDTQRDARDRAEQLADEQCTIENRLAAVEGQSNAHQQELATHSRELNELVVRMSTARERLKAMEDKLEALQSERLRLASEEADRRREIEQLRHQEDEAHAKLDELHHLVETLQRRQLDLTQRLTMETSRKETISLDLHKLGERIQELRRDLNEAQNAFHEEELRRAQLAERYALFEQQAREKFQITLEQLEDEVRRQWAELAPAASPSPQLDADPASETDSQALPADENPTEPCGPPNSPEEITTRIVALREKIAALGPVHVGAIDEYAELTTRYEFLVREERDLQTAKAQLTEVIRNLDATTTDLFITGFEQIRGNFQEMFRRLFGGGRADLVLTEESGVLDCGVDVIAQPPGKKPTHISLLSGGEKALTAIALLFAIFMRKPSPVCILDEIDAPLDDTNIERFKALVREFATTTQFIIISHNKQTMALANTIYGVTMEDEGVSRVVSLRLDEYDDSEFAREEILV